MYRRSMRTTVTLDDDLVSRVQDMTGASSTSALINDVLRYFIEREAARRLAALGGTMPDLAVPDRERPVE
jgi:Arc/MetJ family transcription regulator